jgi:hypothetical protein
MRKAISLMFIFSCALTAFAGEEVKRDFQRTVTIPVGRSFKLVNSFGNVLIRSQSGRSATIRASIECSADTNTEAQKICNDIQIFIQEENNGVTVNTDFPQNTAGRNIGFRVNYDIAVPEDTPLNVQNRFGDVTLTDVRGDAAVHNANGFVRMADGRGPRDIDNMFGNVELRSQQGVIKVTNASGDVVVDNNTGAVRIDNRFGDVTLTNIGGNVAISSSSGSVAVSDITGEVSVTHSFGPVSLKGVSDRANVQNKNGAVTLDDVAGAIAARSSFQGVTITNAGGSVTVDNQNGPLTVEVRAGRRCQDILMRTTFAPMRVTVPAAFGYMLDARTTLGKVNADFQLQDPKRNTSTPNGADRDSSITGRIPGNGSCDLRLTNQNGNIDIVKAN